jgi:hypothetical protein
MNRTGRLPLSKWAAWLSEDITTQIYDSFAGMALDEMQLNFEIRLSAAGFGKRYRKGSWQVAFTKCFVDQMIVAHPGVPPAELCAKLLKQRPNGPQVAREQLQHFMDGMLS